MRKHENKNKQQIQAFAVRCSQDHPIRAKQVDEWCKWVCDASSGGDAMNCTSWICDVCDSGNHILDDKCVVCGYPYGTKAVDVAQKTDDKIDGWE